MCAVDLATLRGGFRTEVGECKSVDLLEVKYLQILRVDAVK